VAGSVVFNVANIPVTTGVDTYINSSGFTTFALTSHVTTGTLFRYRFAVTKTASGTVAPTLNIRCGTTGTTGDAVRCAMALATGTAATGVAWIECEVMVQATGATGVLNANLICFERGITGFASGATGPLIVQTVSTGFDMTTAGMKLGISWNPGTSGIHTFEMASMTAFGTV
jgi:hypothetical protein